MENDCKELTECLCCGGTDLTLVLDLGEQPLANSFVKNPAAPEDVFPLRLNICVKCSHLQLSHAVNPDLLFKNYLYVSGTSKTLLDYFDWFAETVTSQAGTNAKSVLDIACNDGSQLNSFKKLGLTTYGVDPATNLHPISSANHAVLCDYLTREHVTYFADKKIDIITAQNVFAHNSYPLEFLEICRDIMHDGSTLFIQTSQAEMILNNEFDTIYHEHLSFFNTNSMNELAKRAGLYLVGAVKTPIHGTSYVFTFKKVTQDTSAVQKVIDSEYEAGLQYATTYTEYAKKCHRVVEDLNAKVSELVSEGYLIVGYGAAAKGNTLLNFGKTFLDFIIDDNPLKQGLFTPGTHIPVVGIEDLQKENIQKCKIAFVPLAWNFFTEIKSRVKKVRDNDLDVFVKYFPGMSVE